MRFSFGMLVLAAGFAALPAAAEQPGYLLNVIGRVVSVDRAAGTIVFHHGVLETARSGDETCVVPRHQLRFIRPGMTLSGIADTRHHPWRLLEVHRFRADDGTPSTSPSRRLATAEPRAIPVEMD